MNSQNLNSPEEIISNLFQALEQKENELKMQNSSFQQQYTELSQKHADTWQELQRQNSILLDNFNAVVQENKSLQQYREAWEQLAKENEHLKIELQLQDSKNKELEKQNEKLRLECNSLVTDLEIAKKTQNQSPSKLKSSNIIPNLNSQASHIFPKPFSMAKSPSPSHSSIKDPLQRHIDDFEALFSKNSLQFKENLTTFWNYLNEKNMLSVSLFDENYEIIDPTVELPHYSIQYFAQKKPMSYSLASEKRHVSNFVSPQDEIKMVFKKEIDVTSGEFRDFGNNLHFELESINQQKTPLILPIEGVFFVPAKNNALMTCYIIRPFCEQSLHSWLLNKKIHELPKIDQEMKQIFFKNDQEIELIQSVKLIGKSFKELIFCLKSILVSLGKLHSQGISTNSINISSIFFSKSKKSAKSPSLVFSNFKNPENGFKSDIKDFAFLLADLFVEPGYDKETLNFHHDHEQILSILDDKLIARFKNTYKDEISKKCQRALCFFISEVFNAAFDSSPNDSKLAEELSKHAFFQYVQQLYESEDSNNQYC